MTIQQQGFVTDETLIQLEGGTDPTYGNVTWKTLISNDKTESSDLTLGVGYLPANGELPIHKHSSTEFYYFLTGNGVVTIGDQIFPVQKGSVVYIPSDALHMIKANEELSFLYGFAEHSFNDVEYVF